MEICLGCLDIRAPSEPKKRECLLDVYHLDRTIGVAISAAILESLKDNAIDISQCHGQAYNTTASMSSDNVRVQSEILKHAPDVGFHGCCLYSLNLVICYACNISSIQNIMNSCHELFKFFENSPKRPHFLNKVIDALAPENRKRRLKDLCKTRWVARHDTFKTLCSLYEFIVIALNEICFPTDEKRFYPEGNNWNWDRNTKTSKWHTFVNFGHIISFICAKGILEPMRPLVKALQGRLVEVYLCFSRVDEVASCYADIRSEVDMV